MEEPTSSTYVASETKRMNFDWQCFAYLYCFVEAKHNAVRRRFTTFSTYFARSQKIDTSQTKFKQPYLVRVVAPTG